jgi:transcriptional regulator with GAF, ATPase, and Fis domain
VRAPGEIIGQSPGLLRVLAATDRIAPTALSVLVTGETGTGKEGLARRLHDKSGRTGAFVVVNCASLPPELVESELFGHERGAFTGAVGAKRGLVLEADGGTLFLDEVGELPMEVQAKLLRLLQEREVRPLGGQRLIKVDVRVVAATWRDLRARIAEGAFREDLLYRLAVFELALPPLRERGDDVLLLARHVVEGFARQPGIGRRTLGRSAGAALRGHEWRGNVRELQAVLSRAAVLGDGRTINGADIRSALPAVAPAEGSVDERLLALVGSAGEVTMGQVMAALRVPRTTAWRAMAALVESGRVEAVGETKGRRYRVAGAKAVLVDVEPRWEQVLAVARREGMVTRRRVVEVLGVPERTAGRLLAAMAMGGVLAQKGCGRALAYDLPSGAKVTGAPPPCRGLAQNPPPAGAA